jgi:hypothetical protein
MFRIYIRKGVDTGAALKRSRREDDEAVLPSSQLIDPQLYAVHGSAKFNDWSLGSPFSLSNHTQGSDACF